MGVERVLLKSGSGPSGKNFFSGEGEIAAPPPPEPRRHSVLKWALPAASLYSPTPAVSRCLLLSWQLGIKVFTSNTFTGRQRGEVWWVAPLHPPLEDGGANPSLEGLGLGTVAVNSRSGSA